jgi:hypothetical protein
VGLRPHFYMGHIPPPPPNWRNDPGLASTVEYRRKFALWPTICCDGTKVWGKFYYKKYELWSHSYSGKIYREDDYLHTDFIENISEADYIIEKLSGTV